jgi:hypothetical protein
MLRLPHERYLRAIGRLDHDCLSASLRLSSSAYHGMTLYSKHTVSQSYCLLINIDEPLGDDSPSRSVGAASALDSATLTSTAGLAELEVQPISYLMN